MLTLPKRAVAVLAWLTGLGLVFVNSVPHAAAAHRVRASHLQVVAHPDDDILFMNPDLAASIRSGAAMTSTYLTAGESDVVPAQRYAAQRQAGTRAAFARMAGAADVWSRQELEVLPGHTVELQTLVANPKLRLVFVNLPDDNDPAAPGGKHALSRLWDDRTGDVRVETLIPDGSPLATTSTYDRESVVAVLAELYERFTPTVLRSQDPEPDARYQPDWGAHHDHPDHVMAARFAESAEARRVGAARNVHYRDYNVADVPPNLSPDIVADKKDVFAKYAVHDRMVSLSEPYATWLRSMRYRVGAR